MDFGPSRRAADKSDRYHLWDFESDTKNHVLSLLPEQVKTIVVDEETFEPSAFITWDTQKSTWYVERDWDNYS